MITIKPSPTADSRTCDPSTVTKQELLESSAQHICDVADGLYFFQASLIKAAKNHDPDKLTDIDGFYSNFIHKFAEGHNDWYERHLRSNRHHLNENAGIPKNVNLIDVIEHIVDCVMAGMARQGHVYPLVLPSDLLQRAFQNTVTLLKNNVQVEEKELTPID